MPSPVIERSTLGHQLRSADITLEVSSASVDDGMLRKSRRRVEPLTAKRALVRTVVEMYPEDVVLQLRPRAVTLVAIVTFEGARVSEIGPLQAWDGATFRLCVGLASGTVDAVAAPVRVLVSAESAREHHVHQRVLIQRAFPLEFAPASRASESTRLVSFILMLFQFFVRCV